MSTARTTLFAASRTAGRSRNPWLVVLGSGIAQAVSAQPLVLSTFSLFVVPLAAETGWSRTSTLACFTACAVGMAIGMPIVGRLLDRFAVRPIIIAAWLAYCASVALLAIVPLSLPLLYVPYFLIGVFASGTLIPFTKAILSWFDNKRGAGIGVMAALMGLGTTFTPLVASYLIRTAGYRDAYLWMALLALVLGMAMILPFAHARGERDAPQGAQKPGTGDDTTKLPGLSVAEAVRTRHFWMIGFALCLAGIAVVGVQANLVPIMLDRGVAAGQATIALAALGFASLVGRLGGVLLDRFHATIVGALVLAMASVGVMLFLLDDSFATGVMGAALIGIAFGMEIDLLAFYTSRYFGMRRFGSLLGVLQGLVMLCIAIGPVLVGLSYDRLGSYDAVLPFIAGAFGLCAITVLLLGPYRYPAIAGFDRLAAEDEASASAELAAAARGEVGGAGRAV